jgi:hypothetical protein
VITAKKECSCEEYCSRWGKAEDGSYEFWCPLVPKGFSEYGIDCKLYLRKDGSMKQTTIHKDAIDND